MSKFIILRGLTGLGFLVLVLQLFLPVCAASATNTYIAENAAGSSDGSSCANAYQYSFFNAPGHWGSGAGQIGPGTTVHLCGTITAPVATSPILSFHGSGVPGNPITLLWEPGAILQSPDAYIHINLNNTTNIIINGGANGLLQNTLNGTPGAACPGGSCAYQSGAIGIYAKTCTNCIVENLTIANLYVHTSPTDNSTTHNPQQVNCIQISGSNWQIIHNTFHDVGWCIGAGWDPGDNNMTIAFNDVSRMAHGIISSGSTGSGTATNWFIHDNQLHDLENWDTTTGSYHETTIHFFQNGGNPAPTGVYIYNNHFYNPGNNETGTLFFEGGTSPWTTTGFACAFNNVFAGNLITITRGTGSCFYNNTLIGDGSAIPAHANHLVLGCIVCGAGVGGSGYKAKNNIIMGGGGATGNIGYPSQSVFDNWATDNDYNVYGNCSGNLCWGENGFNTSLFGTWQKFPPGGTDLHSKANISSMLNVDQTTGALGSGSLAISAGTNLTSLCSGGLAALCFDINGNPRPSSGAWDAGAYNYGSLSSGKPPSNQIAAPVGLSAVVD